MSMAIKLGRVVIWCPDSSPTDTSPTDKSPTDISPTRHFPDQTLSRPDTSPTDTSPMDISRTRHIPDGRFPDQINFFYSLFDCNIFRNCNFYLHS